MLISPSASSARLSRFRGQEGWRAWQALLCSAVFLNLVRKDCDLALLPMLNPNRDCDNMNMIHLRRQQAALNKQPLPICSPLRQSALHKIPVPCDSLSTASQHRHRGNEQPKHWMVHDNQSYSTQLELDGALGEGLEVYVMPQCSLFHRVPPHLDSQRSTNMSSEGAREATRLPAGHELYL